MRVHRNLSCRCPTLCQWELHLGHAINKAELRGEISAMSGFDAPYVPGWDCHGLPIEHNVERKRQSRSENQLSEFRAAVRITRPVRLKRRNRVSFVWGY